MKNKKAVMAGTLVIVIAIALIFVLMIRFYSAILALMRGLGEGYFWCLLQKVIAAYTEVPVVGITVWSAFCPPVINTITLDKEEGNMINIDKPFSRTEIKNLEKGYPGEPIEDRDWMLKYRLDQTVSNGMKRCWGRNGIGELPLGPKWNKEFWKSKEYIFYCDLCAITKFDTNVQNKINEERKLNEFLKKNPVRPGSSESVWEYLKDKDGIVSDLKDIRYSTDSNLATVYVRGNRNNRNEMIRDVIDILPGYEEKDHPIPVDAVILIPYAEFEKLKCRT